MFTLIFIGFAAFGYMQYEFNNAIAVPSEDDNF